MDMKTLMRNQIQEALRHKWFKGTEMGRDPGPEAVNEWIDTYAETYRKEYDECFEALVKATLKKARPKLREACLRYSDDELAQMAKIILEEFTKVWFLEMTKADHDKHIEEV